MTSRRPAFTVVELLVVIAIIAVLVGVVIVGMSGVRTAANRTESVNALRQMITAYSGYSADHRQNLMPGFVAAGAIGEGPKQIDLEVHLPGVSDPLPKEDIEGYVWRLAPYLDNAWETVMTDYRSNSLVTQLSGEYDRGVYGPGSAEDDDGEGEPLGIAAVPSFGLNSIFVGGDTSHSALDKCPWWDDDENEINFEIRRHIRSRHAATRLSEVRNPAQLIVFGPVAEAFDDAEAGDVDPYEEPVNDLYMGYVELHAPFLDIDNNGAWTLQQWTIGTGGRIEATSAGNYDPITGVDVGLPIVRWGTSEYPVANLDGSTSVEDIGELSSDMRRWSPFTSGTELPPIAP